MRTQAQRAADRDSHEDRDLRSDLSSVHGYHQYDFFDESTGRLATVRDVPRAIRAHTGRVRTRKP